MQMTLGSLDHLDSGTLFVGLSTYAWLLTLFQATKSSWTKSKKVFQSEESLFDSWREKIPFGNSVALWLQQQLPAIVVYTQM